MSKFVIADTHFGDETIIRYENRPFENASYMDKEIIKKWNKVIKADDIVYHLGDVGNYEFQKMKNIIQQLNGIKILITGNHDNNFTIKQWMDIGFSEVYKYPIIVEEFMVMQHQPPQYINDNTPFYYFYGHVHGTTMYQSVTKTSACVSLERWEYAPVSIDKIKDIIAEN